MTALAFLLLIAAFLLMGLAHKKHAKNRLARQPSAGEARRMRLAGWVFMSTSFPFAIAAKGWIFGPVLWSGLVMASAGAAFLTLNLLPEQVRLTGKP